MRGLACLAAAFGLCASAAERPRTAKLPLYHRFEPLAPAEAVKKVRLPPGYRAEIVAAEPMIQDKWRRWGRACRTPGWRRC